jgi:DNA-directed DNA polymerase III PolC
VIHTNYSLRYGTLSVQEAVNLATENNYPFLAITDINNSTGVFEFIKMCLNKGIKPVVGMEFRNGDEFMFTALARNTEGFKEINELRTFCNLHKKPVPDRFDFKECYVIYPFGKIDSKNLKENEFIGICPHQINKRLFDTIQQKRKYVIQAVFTFKDEKGYELHRKLRAVDHNILLSQLKPQHLAGADERIISYEELLKRYEQMPQLIENYLRIMDECNFSFDFKSGKNKRTFTGNKYDDKLLLEKLALDGLKFRYGNNNKIATERVKKELEIIYNLDFSAYFLITWDIIRYSMSRGYYHVGRGSGANSVVAYCLRITDVCPIELNLYFERFLNPKRKSPPDFDIDFSWKERDDVVDYIFKRYGHKNTALLGAMSTFKDRSIIRELGKIHGLPKSEIDRLISNPQSPLNKNELAKKVLEYYQEIEDFPNMRTLHSCGILISEEPITNYTALDLPPKGLPTVQFDMHLAEDIGFEKFDILSQRGIGHIKDAAEIILKNQGVKIDVHDIQKFKTDEQVKKQMKAGETIGCFYIESPAMRGLLKKLKCDNYLSLVAASSIIRPGVAKSGMMREYISRFHNPEKFEYLHPVMKEQLSETYGVMVYQEDVLKVGHHFGGLDLADADVLRRMMSGKSRSKKHMLEIEQKYFDHCKKQNYPEHIAKEVWRQMESFAGYSFSKAHSASFAVESYQSLYLKSHYPLEFMTAVINNFGGFYNTGVYFNEAKLAGAKIHLPCVNQSEYNTCIVEKNIWIGFIHLKGIETSLAQKISIERESNGNYKSLENFIQRLPVRLEQLIILIRIDAFRFTEKNKKQLLWEAHLLLNRAKEKPAANQLFEMPQKEFTLPTFDHNHIEDVYDEIEFLGFPVSKNYFEMLKTDFKGDCLAKNLPEYLGKTVKVLGEFITYKPVRTVRKEIMGFGTFLDAEGKFFDTVQFPDCFQKYPFTGAGVYLILGKVVEEFGFPSIEVEKMARLPIHSDPRVG